VIVFWYAVPCSLVEIYLHFKCANYLHHQAIIALMLECVNTYETSVYFYDITRHSTQISGGGGAMKNCTNCMENRKL
jgi:hypothetical protein